MNLDRINEGKENDLPLLPNDVLFVPRASARVFWTPVGTAILTTMPYVLGTLAAAGRF